MGMLLAEHTDLLRAGGQIFGVGFLHLKIWSSKGHPPCILLNFCQGYYNKGAKLSMFEEIHLSAPSIFPVSPSQSLIAKPVAPTTCFHLLGLR